MSRKPNSIRSNAQKANEFLEGNTGDEPTPAEEVTPTETPKEEAAVDVEPAPQPASVPEPANNAELENVKHQLSVLQGKYNAEVPRLSTENRTLKSDVARLTLEKEQLQEQLKTRQVKPVSNPSIDHIREEYGDEMASLATAQDQRIEVQDQQISELKQVIESLRGEFNGRIEKTEQVATKTASSTREQTFASMLKQQGLDLNQMNNDQNFVAWLDEVDPYSGMPRVDLMRSAYKNDELARAAKFFIDFASLQKPAAEAPAVTPPKPPVTAQSSASLSEVIPVDDGPMAPDEITAFYAAKRQGRLTAEEIRVGENRIFRSR